MRGLLSRNFRLLCGSAVLRRFYILLEQHVHMKRHHLAVYFIITAIISSATILIVRALYAQSGNRVAFTATMTEDFYRYPGGEFVTSKQSTDAYSANGSRVRLQALVAPSGTSVEKKTIIDVLSQKRIVVDGLTESLTTYNLRKDDIIALQSKPTSCGEAPSAERSSILGYEVVKVIRDWSPPSEAINRIESWKALALDCYPLKEIFYHGQPGSTVVTNIRQVTAVSIGEPNLDLFAVPAGYVERPPTAVYREHENRYPNAPLSVGPRNPEQDRAYFKQHP